MNQPRIVLLEELSKRCDAAMADTLPSGDEITDAGRSRLVADILRDLIAALLRNKV